MRHHHTEGQTLHAWQRLALAAVNVSALSAEERLWYDIQRTSKTERIQELIKISDRPSDELKKCIRRMEEVTYG